MTKSKTLKSKFVTLLLQKKLHVLTNLIPNEEAHITINYTPIENVVHIIYSLFTGPRKRIRIHEGLLRFVA